MSWEGFWAPNIVQLLVFAPLTALVVALVRHLARQRREQLLLILRLISGAPGAEDDAARLLSRPVTLKRYRKAFAAGISAGLGVILIGLLTWASTLEQLEPLLGPLVAPSVRPLVGVLLGGLALTASTTIAVIKAPRNAEPSDAPLTLDEPAPPADGGVSLEPAGTAPTAAEVATPQDPLGPTSAVAAGLVYTRPPVTPDAAPTFARVPFWAGVPAGEPEAATSRVELLPAPVRDYR